MAGSSTGGAAGSGAAGAGGSAGAAAALHCDMSGTDLCTCIEAGGGNAPTPGVTCGPTDVGGGYCCADIGYPGGIHTCQCTNWGCFNGSVCSCGPNGGTDTACKPGFAHCCVPTSEILNPTMCRCSNFACQPSDTEVTSCGIDMAGCSNGRLRIDLCAN